MQRGMLALVEVQVGSCSLPDFMCMLTACYAAGMYGHMSVFKRTGADVLRPTEGVAGRGGPAGDGDLGGGSGSGSKSFLFSSGHGARPGANTRKPLRKRVSEHRKLTQGSAAGMRKPGSNIRQVVQGRSRRVGPPTGATSDDSAFAKCVGGARSTAFACLETGGGIMCAYSSLVAP